MKFRPIKPLNFTIKVASDHSKKNSLLNNEIAIFSSIYDYNDICYVKTDFKKNHKKKKCSFLEDYEYFNSTYNYKDIHDIKTNFSKNYEKMF